MNNQAEEKGTIKSAILNHLMEGRTITPMEALRLYGCFRLADVIFRLKNEGYRIETAIRTIDKPSQITGKLTKKRFAEYDLVKK